MPPNTTVASFDIGIRHLAYCVLTQDHGCTDVAKAYEIIEWDVVDLLYVSGTIYEDICVRETAKEWRVDKLRQWLAEHQLDAEGKRSQLIDRVCKHLQKRGVPKLSANKSGVLAVQLFHFLDQHPQLLAAQYVIIENQPALKNPTMKSVQMMLYAYFMYRGVYARDAHREVQHVQMMSANNKLKVYDGPPIQLKKSANGQSFKKYKKTKLLSIAHAQYYLRLWSGVEPNAPEPNAPEPNSLDLMASRKEAMRSWLHFLNASNKQDDLGDCLLQGMYALRHVCQKNSKKAVASAVVQ